MTAFSGLLALTIAFVPASVVASGAVPKTADAAEKIAATEVAARFLDLVDGGQYGSTWDLTGDHMRRLTARPIWATTLSSIRANTGAIQTRSVVEASFSKVLRNSPPGHYFTVRFDSRFERMAMEEKVVVNLELGQWKVEGYTVTPRTGRKSR